jgi:hypothetical protein
VLCIRKVPAPLQHKFYFKFTSPIKPQREQNASNTNQHFGLKGGAVPRVRKQMCLDHDNLEKLTVVRMTACVAIFDTASLLVLLMNEK